MSLTDIHERAARFQSRIRLRNLIEYAAGGIVIFAFGAIALETPDVGVRIGVALIILGVLYIHWRLATLAGAAAKDPSVAWAEFHRAELVRQRDAMRSVWAWYLAPLSPGAIVYIAACAFAPSVDLPFAARLAFALLGAAWVAGVFFGVAWLNRRRAEKLDAEIAALDHARE